MHRLEHCPLCHSYDGMVLETASRSQHPLLMLLCKSCGLIHAEEGSTVMLPPKVNRRHLWREAQVAKKLLGVMAPLLPQGAYGCDTAAGSGVLMYAFKRAGYTMTGTEDAATKLQYARDVLGVRVENGRLNDLRCTDNVFDFMMVRDLGTTADPLGLLLKAYLKLKSDGVLCVHVPNAVTLLRRRRHGKRFANACTHAFTGLTLRALAYKAGFSPTDDNIDTTTVVFRKTHAPQPQRAIVLEEHAAFLQRCASEKRPTLHMQRLRQKGKVIYQSVLSMLTGTPPTEMLIKAIQG